VSVSAVRLLLALPALVLAACASQENLTAEATGCSKRDVTVVSSEFKRKGFETAWCAQCKDKRYQCVTNADRTRVECFEAKEGGPCL
jgi:hypothetical protein